MTQTLDTKSLNMLVAALIQEETRRFETLPNAQDWPDFRYRVGFLAGCAFAREECNRVERDLFGGDTKKS